MTLVVTHATVTGASADPTALVDGPAWDANHTLTGEAEASQLNSNVVQSVVSDTNVTGSVVSQVLTLGWQSTLAATRGGTGQSAFALGDLLYSSSTNTLSKLAGNTTTTKKFLQQTGSGSASAAPAWGQPAFGDITFTQSGTGGTAVDLGTLYTDTILTPEMFDTAANIATNAQTAIQRAIDRCAALGAGTVKLAPKRYILNGGLTISHNGITIEGTTSVQNAGTELYYTPAAQAQAAISVSNGASIVSGTTLRNFSLKSPDTTTYKIGIDLVDTSFTILENVYVHSFTGGFSDSVTGAVSSGGEIRLTVASAATSWNDGYGVLVSGVGGTTEANFSWPIIVSGGTTIDLKGSTFTNAFASNGTITMASTAIRLRGRELNFFRNVTASGDIGLRIAKNPNLSTYALDQSNFHNMTIVSASTGACVQIDDGVTMTSVSFTGAQSWGGGKNALQWRDKSSSSINEQISFENVRAEQKSVTGGWYFDFAQAQLIYSLRIVNTLISDRNGFRVRNVANLTITSPHCLNATGVAIDLDSTVGTTAIDGGYWIAGSTATLSGQNTLMATANTTGGAMSPTARLSSSANANTFGASNFTGAALSTSATAGLGYGTGAGGTVTQGTNRTTGVTLNKVTGAITLFSAAGSATYNTFTVTNSAVAATDTVVVSQKSGTDKYIILVTAVAAGSFAISFATTGGTTVEQPVFSFTVIKGVTS